MKICPNCSARNYDNAEVCFSCRTSLANVPVYPDPVSQMPVGINGYMQPAQQNQNYPIYSNQIPKQAIQPVSSHNSQTASKRKRKKNGLMIVLIIAAGLLLTTNIVTLVLLLNSENMKYKDAYLTIQKTLVTQNLQAAVSSALGRGDSDGGTGTGQSLTAGDVPVTGLSQNIEPTATPEPKIEYLPLELKQRFDLQDIEIQLDSVQWGDEIKPSNTSGYYNYYSDNDGEKFFYILGTAKNNKGENIDLDYGLKVNFVFNDKYTYAATIVGEEKDGTGFWNFETTVNPLQKKTFLIYRSVPDEVKNIFDHCVVSIGFNDDFSSVRYDDFEKMDKVYQLYVR